MNAIFVRLIVIKDYFFYIKIDNVKVRFVFAEGYDAFSFDSCYIDD